VHTRIDLNADVGEGFGRWSLGDDNALLGIVSSANVACGFHAGDASIMRRTCRLAAEREVAVGAQVSYPDLAGFGRRFIDIDPAELVDVVLYQIGALERLARVEGTAVRYVKPHGALYHAVVHHEQQAAAVVEAIELHGGGLALLTLPGSAAGRMAAGRGIAVVEEGFADRGYLPDGTLVPRGRPGALLTGPAEVVAQARRVIAAGARSVCVHSDTPGAALLARAVRDALTADGVTVGPFA
jgi:UPF0271 protein